MMTELDPIFVKGLRLLHSKNKDSTEQLKQLLDDVIAQSKSSYSKDRIYTSVKLEGESKIHIKKTLRDMPEATNYSSKFSGDDVREKKADKKHSDKTKPDVLEVEAKIPKLEPPQGYSYYESSPPDLPKLDQYVVPKRVDDDSDSSEENADDFAMEMGLACVICKQLDVSVGNQLIECQECHSLYHQECHRPPATDYDINDPRRVWYCAKCMKNMKKMATKTQKTAKSGVTSQSKEPPTPTKTAKAEGSPPSLMLPFKRSEVKTPISQGNNQTTANKPIGLAGLAANFGSRTTTTSAPTSLTPATRGTKASSPGLNLKTPFSLASSTKTSSLSSSSTVSKIPSTSSSFQSTMTSSSTTQKTTSSAPPTKGLGLLSAAVASAASSRAAAAAPPGNGSSKAPSCSPLMSADKRLQIMKKKASKLQERRRLSNK